MNNSKETRKDDLLRLIKWIADYPDMWTKVTTELFKRRRMYGSCSRIGRARISFIDSSIFRKLSGNGNGIWNGQASCL